MTLSAVEVYNLHTNEGDGPENISPLFLRNCAMNLSVPLCILFNMSLTSGIFPAQWKTSRITPIFKFGSRSNVENYRGIAILPTIGKLNVYYAHNPHFRHVITEFQHGRSTSTNLIECMLQLSDR